MESRVTITGPQSDVVAITARLSVRQGLLTAAAQGIGRETSPNIGKASER